MNSRQSAQPGQLGQLQQLRSQGNEHFAQGRFQEAHQFYSQAIRCWYLCIGYQNPPDAVVRNSRESSSVTSSLRSAWKQTVDWMKQGACIGGGQPLSVNGEWPLMQGEAAIQSTETAPSLSDFDYASVDPDWIEQGKPHVLFGNRSAALWQLKRYPEALVDAQWASAWQPDWPKGYYRQGEAYSALRQFQAALESYQLALEKLVGVVHLQVDHPAHLEGLGRETRCIIDYY